MRWLKHMPCRVSQVTVFKFVNRLNKMLVFTGDFKSAVPYCQQSCEAVGVVYGYNSVEVADEKEKISQLLFHRSVEPTQLLCCVEIYM